MRSHNAAALDRGVASGEFLAQPALDPVGHRMDNVIVDLIGDFLRKMGRSVGHALTWKCGSILGVEKHRTHGSGAHQSKSFHLLSLLFIFRQHSRGSYSSLLREKLRVVSRFTSVNVRCR